MKKRLILSLFFLFITLSFFADDYTYFNLGPSLALGARYDPVRMCVASPASFPGGFAGEFLGLTFEYRFNKAVGIGGYLPIARPILFGAAFNMLQFLPEAVITFHIPIKKPIEFVFQQGIGASLHYGPDYHSDQNNKGPSFFAAGPRVSLLFGPHITIKKNYIIIIGLKPYFEYLFSDRIHGPVGGCELDIQFRYAFR